MLEKRKTPVLTYTRAQMWCVGDKGTGCVVRGQEEEQELKEVCMCVFSRRVPAAGLELQLM